MRITSPPPAIPACSAIQPAWRPMTSSTMIRSWLAAVVCRRSSASVAQATALSKPNVKAVAERSLSIVFGTPITGIPNSWNCWAIVSEPSPPTQISPHRPSCSTVMPAAASNSTSICWRSSMPARATKRPLLVEPRIVPPSVEMPDVFLLLSGMKLTGSTSPSIAAEKADRLVIELRGRLEHSADHRVQAGTIAATRKNSKSVFHGTGEAEG